MRYLYSFIFALFCFSTSPALADTDPKKEDPKPQTDTEKLAAALKREEDLKLELDAEKKKPKKDPDPKPDDDDLRTKAAKTKQSADDAGKESKRIESAITFNLSVDNFIKGNADLLPAEIAEIVKVAHKETYDSAVAKANALKAAVVQAYFAVQGNLDNLTTSQKLNLDEYLKLTKTAKEDKAAAIYETVFEPAIEMVRRVKKAEELGRSRAQGISSGSPSDNAYRDRLAKGSRKSHLGEKEG